MTIQLYTECTQLKVNQWINAKPYAGIPAQIARIMPTTVELKHYHPELVNLVQVRRTILARSAIGWVCETFEEAAHMHKQGHELQYRIAEAQIEFEARVRRMVSDFKTTEPLKFV